MITFLDENDVEYGVLATIKATNAVNGERSLTGTIVSGDYVLSNIERGWRLRFDDEYYVVTYAKPIDEGRDVQVTFDAVHQFFWDFDKSSVYDQLTDGSHTFAAYLDFIFKNSGYSYTVDSALNVYAFEKQSFGLKKRLTLFNDVITSTGVEFQVNGKVVRILEKVGTDLSTVVRKNFNMNELTIEKNIGDFVTYQKGYGAYFDEEDHSKGRLVVEYTSPLASVYGKLEAEPFVDERYSQSSSLLAVLKENVDNSYTISVSLDMEDLTRAGYKYKQPVAGDYIMAINETLDFQEKIRIVSFASEYDVQGNLVKHEVTCNDIGTVKKLTASYNLTKKQASSASATASNAYSIANKALVSADGKNTNYYSNSFPIDNPKGTLKTGDLLFLTVGDTVKQYYWNGADWITNPVVSDIEAFKEQITEELKDVPNREEFENKISEELANSKAEIETQIDTAKTQAESNAKAYADEINQATAEAAEQANTAANSLKSDLAKVKTDLTTVTNTANSAKTSASEAKQQLTTVANDLSTAKQDLQTQASQLTAQANAQSELTKRVSSVEETANGTKTTVSELSKTVEQNGKDITSVTARTKVVEDDLAGTKTTLSQVKTTADSASQKTATLETGLNGLNARFDNLRVGTVNLLKNSKTFIGSNITGQSTLLSETYNDCAVRYLKNTNPNSDRQELAQFNNCVYPKLGGEYVASFWAKGRGELSIFFHGDSNYLQVASGSSSWGGNPASYDGRITLNLTDDWKRYWIKYKLKTEPASATSIGKRLLFRHNNSSTEDEIYLAGVQLEEGNIPTDYSPNEADLEQKVAEYKQNADQNYASLQTTVQNLDGTVKQNKSEFDQTASQIKSSISAVEGKIPTNIGTVNLIKQSTAQKGLRLSSGAGTFADANHMLTDWIKVEPSTVYTLTTYEDVNEANMYYSLAWYSTNNADYSGWISRPTGAAAAADLKNGRQYASPANAAYAKVSYPTKYSKVKLERGNIATDYNPSPEDYDDAITQVKSEIKQTADGITLLATKTELNTAKNELQSGITTATNKANAAQNTANSNAQTITTHTTQISALNTGLSAKVSQSDFNTLSGRVTTAENNITAKANELSSKITSVEGKIPTSVGGRNLIIRSQIQNGYIDANGNLATATSKFTTGFIDGTNNKQFTITAPKFALGNLEWLRLAKYDANKNFLERELFIYDSNNDKTIKTITLPDNVHYFKVSFDGLYEEPFKIERGSLPTDWSPAPEDYDSALATAQSEIKQTTDSIKASVSSLDESTVKTASLTINTDGVVMKAGKSTTDVANAIGSYFAVNQNAINLFSDKINVKGSMIVDGAITSAKIASKSINTAHLNGKIITADVIATGAITADAIKAGAVTTDKMTANSINGDRITAGTLDAAKIKAGSITASQIASGTITSSQIKAGGISAANIATGAITADKIAANAIDVSKITGDTANFVKAAFKSLYSDLDITGESLKFSSIVGNSFEISNTNYLLKLNYGAHYAGINPLNYGGISIGMGLAGLFSIRGVNRTDGTENIFLELSREQARIGTHTSYIRITNQKISIVKNNSVVQQY